MSTNKNVNDPEVKIEETLSNTEKILEKYRKAIVGVIVAFLVIAGGIFAYNEFIVKPKKQEAMSQIFKAEQLFRADNFETALNGDGNILGFNQIIADYGSKAGKAVYFYAGICNLQLGKFDEAISMLSKYKTKDQILQARATAAIGDAYAGLNDFNNAISYYKQAAKDSDDKVLTANYLFKAAIMYEEAGNPDEALKIYEEIKNKYPQTPEGFEIEKYISRIKVTK
jgi:hypothetical protein